MLLDCDYHILNSSLEQEQNKIAKTKYCHQVTVMSLNHLMKAAYAESLSKNGKKKKKSFDKWRSEMEGENAQFRFWSIALKMELDYLTFLRSIRLSTSSVTSYQLADFYRGFLHLTMYIMLVG